MENCIFCKIINKEIPCYKIYEDEKVLAFLDINPKSNGHTLIIPKKHTKDFESISEDELNYLMKIAKKIFDLLKNKLSPKGIRIVQNNGCLQDVKHFHIHLIPVYDEEQSILDVKEIYEKLIKK